MLIVFQHGLDISRLMLRNLGRDISFPIFIKRKIDRKKFKQEKTEKELKQQIFRDLGKMMSFKFAVSVSNLFISFKRLIISFEWYNKSFKRNILCFDFHSNFLVSIPVLVNRKGNIPIGVPYEAVKS